MEARTLVMELRRRAIKRWVPCGDMDRRLKIPHLAKAKCGFRTTPEKRLYDSGPIGPSVEGLIILYNTIQSLKIVIKIYSSGLKQRPVVEYYYYYLYYVHETVQHNMHIIQGIKKTIKLQNTSMCTT